MIILIYVLLLDYRLHLMMVVFVLLASDYLLESGIYLHTSSSIQSQYRRNESGRVLKVSKRGGYCSGNVVDIVDSQKVTIEDCSLNGSGSSGVYFINSAHIKISSNKILNCTESIFWFGAPGLNDDFSHEFLVERNLTYTDSIIFGIMNYGRQKSVLIRNNTFVLEKKSECPILIIESKPNLRNGIIFTDNVFYQITAIAVRDRGIL